MTCRMFRFGHEMSCSMPGFSHTMKCRMPDFGHGELQDDDDDDDDGAEYKYRHGNLPCLLATVLSSRAVKRCRSTAGRSRRRWCQNGYGFEAEMHTSQDQWLHTHRSQAWKVYKDTLEGTSGDSAGLNPIQHTTKTTSLAHQRIGGI